MKDNTDYFIFSLFTCPIYSHLHCSSSSRFYLVIKPHIDHLAAALLWHQVTVWASHEEKPKMIFYTPGRGSLAPVRSQQQLHPRPSVEHVEATWGLFYHLAAQTHTWHTCQRGLSQGTDPIGVVGLPLETRQNGSSVLHGQLKREGGRWGVDERMQEEGGCRLKRKDKMPMWQEKWQNKNRWERKINARQKMEYKKLRWREQMIEDSENSLREIEEEERL